MLADIDCLRLFQLGLLAASFMRTGARWPSATSWPDQGLVEFVARVVAGMARLMA